ncbi:hypothetical protein P4O66_022318, partial [Electrophorus voltai]
PIVRRSKPLLKQVRTWPAGAISALQDCFEQTTWITFKEAASDSGTVNLEEYTASVTGYISKCIDDVTVSKTITTHPNQKPWMPAEVRMLLRTRDSAFRTGDREALRKTRAKLSRAIREAKRAHAQRIHGHFKDTGNTRRMWEGIRANTNYRKTPPSCDSDATLPDALNDFYARFEVQNNIAAEKSIPPQNDQTTSRVVYSENVLTDIFNISLSCAVVPTCFKTTTIVPVPKKPTVLCLNDYRPIALISIMLQSMHNSNHIIKFADDTTVVGLINKDNESAYREEVQELLLSGDRQEHHFLSVHIAENLTWTLNTRERAQRRLYFLRKLRKALLPSPILTTFYRGTVESILSSCIITWFGNCTSFDRKTLQRI